MKTQKHHIKDLKGKEITRYDSACGTVYTAKIENISINNGFIIIHTNPLNFCFEDENFLDLLFEGKTKANIWYGNYEEYTIQ